MSVNDCIQSHTWRQYRAWQMWLDAEYDMPSRSDYYLMQIAMAVRQTFSKNPNRIKMRHFLLHFNRDNSSNLSWTERVRRSKSKWKGLLGIGKDNGNHSRSRHPDS